MLKHRFEIVGSETFQRGKFGLEADDFALVEFIVADEELVGVEAGAHFLMGAGLAVPTDFVDTAAFEMFGIRINEASFGVEDTNGDKVRCIQFKSETDTIIKGIGIDQHFGQGSDGLSDLGDQGGFNSNVGGQV